MCVWKERRVRREMVDR
jgi:hypothetical protein